MSSNAAKVAIGAALALLLAIVFFRSGDDSQPEGSSSLQVDQKAAEALRQRLGQPHAREEQQDAAADSVRVEPNAPAGRPAAEVAPGHAAAPAAPKGVAMGQHAADQGAPPAQIDEAKAAGVHKMMDDLPALKQMAVTDKDPDKRLEAVTLLGATEEPEVVPVLGQALSDEDAEVRLAAIQALADFTGDGAFDLLGKAALDDPEPDNRYEALEALSDTDDERANLFAKRALQDPDEEVRDLAETMLGMDEPAGAPAPAMQR